MKQAPPTVSARLTASRSSDMRLKGGAMDTIYIGVDFHARQQTICYLKTETGELVTLELKHQDKEKVRAFYAEFPRLHRPSLQSREVMRMLRYRHKLIKMRTRSKNSLQALALQAGLAKRS